MLNDLIGTIRGFAYRKLMVFSHKYNWHYMPPLYPEGGKQVWCRWCGIRHTIATKESRRKALHGLTKNT